MTSVTETLDFVFIGGPDDGYVGQVRAPRHPLDTIVGHSGTVYEVVAGSRGAHRDGLGRRIYAAPGAITVKTVGATLEADERSLVGMPEPPVLEFTLSRLNAKLRRQLDRLDVHGIEWSTLTLAADSGDALRGWVRRVTRLSVEARVRRA